MVGEDLICQLCRTHAHSRGLGCDMRLNVEPLDSRHTHMQQSRSHSAHKEIGQKFLGSQIDLQRAAKHPQREHIEEHMLKIGVQEHIGKELVEVKLLATNPIQHSVFADCIANRQNSTRQPHHEVGDNQIQRYGWRGKRATSKLVIHLFKLFSFIRSLYPNRERISPVEISTIIALPDGAKLIFSHAANRANRASVCSALITPRIAAARRCATIAANC